MWQVQKGEQPSSSGGVTTATVLDNELGSLLQLLKEDAARV